MANVEAQKLANSFLEKSHAVSVLVEKLNNLSDVGNLAKEIIHAVDVFKIEDCDEIISIISNESEHLKFLHIISDGKSSLKYLKDLFSPIEDGFSILKNNINKEIDTSIGKFSLKIYKEIDYEVAVIEEWHLEHAESFDLQKIPNEISRGREILSKILNT